MKLEINITKGKFWVLLSVGLLMVAALVIASNHEKPNPGHSLEEVGELNDRLLALDTSYKLDCITGEISGGDGEIDGGDGNIEKVGNRRGETNTMQCINDYTMTGCAARSGEADTDTTMYDNKCAQGSNDDNPTTQIRCCKLVQE
jgi:hypothetical protein